MAVSKEKEELYKKMMEDAKSQLKEIDDQMQEEIQKIREKLAELQAAKKNFQQVYDGAAKILGIETKLEDEEESNNSDPSSIDLEETKE
jgi:ABC-type Zn uptake system ZnuABC Zn-binding protein ZnuA